jgi:hypothetical protein
MRVAFFWKVQQAVGWVQVGGAPVAIGQALDGHVAEHGGQGSFVSGLDAAVAETVGVGHLGALLPPGSQVEVVLEETA